MLRAPRDVVRRVTSSVPKLSRGFLTVATPKNLQGSGGVFVTKYRIVKPGREGTDWDDFLLALPDKDSLATETKDAMLFLRYLKVVCDSEKRPEDFTAFMERAKNGLEVESDVFLTTEELLAVMWKNGYSEQERNAIQFTFPQDHKFHYPELAAAFNLTEEDCYKFCMRSRIEKSHIGEVKTDAVVRKGFIRDHWLMFGVGAIIFKTFPFFNYYFILKGFGTVMWSYTNYLLANRWISGVISRNAFMMEQQVAKEVHEGEDKIMEAMQRFGNDSRCLNNLKGLKGDVSTAMVEYRAAVLEVEKNNVISKIQKQLASIAQMEDTISSRLQEIMVKEIAADFKTQAETGKFSDAAFKSALANLEGAKGATDPVSQHFMTQLGSIKLDGSAKANKAGTINERIAYAQQQGEEEFKNAFYISQKEVSEAKAAASDATKLEKCMTQLYQKIGYHIPGGSYKPAALSSGDDLAKKINDETAKLYEGLRKKNLEGFSASLA